MTIHINNKKITGLNEEVNKKMFSNLSLKLYDHIKSSCSIRRNTRER